MTTVNDRIAALRRQHRISQAELARRLGVSRTIVGNYERGETTPSVETVAKLARVFDVSTDYLLGQGDTARYDKAALRRLEAIDELDDDTRSHLFFLIDNVVQNYRAKRAYEPA